MYLSLGTWFFYECINESVFKEALPVRAMAPAWLSVSDMQTCCGLFCIVWPAGLVMTYKQGDSSLHADIHQTLHLVCSGCVAAALNTQLSSGDSSQKVEELLAVVATVSTAKAAEVERLMAESQKVQPVIFKPQFCLDSALPLMPHMCHYHLASQPLMSADCTCGLMNLDKWTVQFGATALQSYL